MGVTEHPRSLNPSKAIAMAICPIIVHFSTWCARSMHDVACEFARAAVRSKDAQKQLARTSLIVYVIFTIFVYLFTVSPISTTMLNTLDVNFCKDHRNKIEVPDPLTVENLISSKLNNKRKFARLITQYRDIFFPIFRNARPSFFRELQRMTKVFNVTCNVKF